MNVVYYKPNQPMNSTPHLDSNDACPECLLDVDIHIDPTGMVALVGELRHRAAGEVIVPNPTPKQVLQIGYVRRGWITLHRTANTDWVGSFSELADWFNFTAEDLCMAAGASAGLGIDLIDFPVPVVAVALEVLDFGPHDAENIEAFAIMRRIQAEEQGAA